MVIEKGQEDALVRYFGEILASKSQVPLQQAIDVVEECIRDEVRSAPERGLDRLNLAMGRMMLGQQPAPNAYVARYVDAIRAQESERWRDERVTNQDIIWWWDLGGVVHGAYIAFDNFFNMAQVVDAAENAQGMESVEEVMEYATWSLRKRFPLFGPSGADPQPEPEDSRLPMELRRRVDDWSLRIRRESANELFQAIENFSSYNAMCRYWIRFGVI